eukprot:6418347-Amphidinium_carterae.3
MADVLLDTSIAGYQVVDQKLIIAFFDQQTHRNSDRRVSRRLKSCCTQDRGRLMRRSRLSFFVEMQRQHDTNSTFANAHEGEASSKAGKADAGASVESADMVGGVP